MKRFVALTATLVSAVAFADNFLWKNYNTTAYYDWDAAASWYVGSDYVTNCVDATRAPGENDTIAYSVRKNGAYTTDGYLSADLGGNTVTIKGFSDPHTSWKEVKMKFTNGTLKITDSYGVQYAQIVFDNAAFIATETSGVSGKPYLGASGVHEQFFFKNSSCGEFYGTIPVYGARFYVDETSTLVFSPKAFFWSNAQGGLHGIDNKGTASFPVGLVMGCESLQNNNIRYFGVTNCVGATMTIVGDVAANFPAKTATNAAYFDFHVR